MTGRFSKAQLDDLAVLLAEVGEFLRSPCGHAALDAFYAARGNPSPGYNPGLLVDHVSFTALWLRGKTAPRAQRS